MKAGLTSNTCPHNNKRLSPFYKHPLSPFLEVLSSKFKRHRDRTERQLLTAMAWRFTCFLSKTRITAARGLKVPCPQCVGSLVFFHGSVGPVVALRSHGLREHDAKILNSHSVLDMGTLLLSLFTYLVIN